MGATTGLQAFLLLLLSFEQYFGWDLMESSVALCLAETFVRNQIQVENTFLRVDECFLLPKESGRESYTVKFLMEMKICWIHLEVKFHHGVRRLTGIIQQMLNSSGKYTTQTFVFVCERFRIRTCRYITCPKVLRPEDVSAAVPRELSIFFACLSVCVCVCCFEAWSFTTWNSPSMLG